MKTTHKPAKYEYINPGDYKHASPWDLWEEALQLTDSNVDGQVKNTDRAKARELIRLGDSKNERMWRDPARMALAYGFDSTEQYLEWCSVVGMGAR